MPISLDIMPLEPLTPEPPPPKTMVVRYGYLKFIGEFESAVQEKVACGSRLVARTSRGVEIVEMLTTLCANGGCNKAITREQLLDYVKQSGGKDFPFTNSGLILRLAAPLDLARQQQLDSQRDEYLKIARSMVQVHRVPMKMVEVEFLLGGEKIIFYFNSEHRVDFRSLIRDMAHQLHARIDLHQVAARDEARLVADYEKCGQHCCCKQFLKVLTPVSMRAAKIQKATLDPAKINGRCGRLMCCLRYEDETYEELRKRLPCKHSRVRTAVGEGWVIDGQILTQLVLVQYDNGNQVAVPMESIEAFDLPKPLNSSGRTMQFPGDGEEAPSSLPHGGSVSSKPGAPEPKNGPARSPPSRPQPAGQRRESGNPVTAPGVRTMRNNRNAGGKRGRRDHRGLQSPPSNRGPNQPPRGGPPGAANAAPKPPPDTQ
ncbi:MAG: regulatory iron-sulfur-containing complex subunit RicT [Phycisphaerae bacterium]